MDDIWYRYVARKEREIRMMLARHDRAVEYLAAAQAMRDRGYVRERTGLPGPVVTPCVS